MMVTPPINSRAFSTSPNIKFEKMKQKKILKRPCGRYEWGWYLQVTPRNKDITQPRGVEYCVRSFIDLLYRKIRKFFLLLNATKRCEGEKHLTEHIAPRSDCNRFCFPVRVLFVKDKLPLKEDVQCRGYSISQENYVPHKAAYRKVWSIVLRCLVRFFSHSNNYSFNRS